MKWVEYVYMRMVSREDLQFNSFGKCVRATEDTRVVFHSRGRSCWQCAFVERKLELINNSMRWSPVSCFSFNAPDRDIRIHNEARVYQILVVLSSPF